jgi:exopolysaccharide production protein ExoQ
MPPQLALLSCIVFVLYLFWVDRKRSNGFSNALWIPLAWMFLAGSRYVSQWLSLSAPGSIDEGNPVNAASFFVLIAAGFFVLLRRKIDWGLLLSQNKWVWLYLFYCAISFIWSDYPFISFKRWIKELGNLIMVLVILTEKHPYQAMGVILRRFAFLTLPLSIVFNKYFPYLSRAFHSHSGVMIFTGIGQQKNDLGTMCLMSGIYFFWNFLLNREKDFKSGGRSNIIDFMILGMVVYLLQGADSATSLSCLVVAASLFFVSRPAIIGQKSDRIMVLVIVVVALYLVLDATLNLRDIILEILGRDATLTTRTTIWEVVKEMGTNPIVGTGYQSFWLGERLEIFVEKMGVVFNQAHNGYLEQYLNLGYIGVAFIGIIILSGLSKIRRHLSVDYPSAMLRLCFIVTALLFNYTEASFYGINNIWLLTLFGVIEISYQKKTSDQNGKS